MISLTEKTFLNLTLTKGTRLQFDLEGSFNSKIQEVWQVMSINAGDKTVFIAKVGKNGKLLKPNAQNMKHVTWSWLVYGIDLENVRIIEEAQA